MRRSSCRDPRPYVLALLAGALAACPTRGRLEPLPTITPKADAGPTRDLGPTPDEVDPPEDAPGDDVPDAGTADAPDGSVLPPCPAPTTPTRADPCASRGADCGFPLTARVSIAGATTALTDFQVRVEIPTTLRALLGPTCDRMVFRTADNQWAPHFVTDCAAGVVWVRAPSIAPGGTTLTLRYGATTSFAAANSYDDTFDRVPTRAANVLGAYSFDEGAGARTCPSAGDAPFDAYIHQDLYRARHPEVQGPDPELWSTESAPSALAPTDPNARFRRNQFALNFPLVQTLDPDRPDAGATPNRPINWRSRGPAPFNAARDQLTVGVWVRPLSPSNAFNDNFQTVVCFGMPDLAARAAHWMLPETDPRIVNNAIFNPWAIFFRGDGMDDTVYQGNTCVEPCLDVIQYAHITTTEPLSGSAFVNNWHFLAFTFDRTTTPHTTRRSYYDDRVYNYPAELELFPQDRVYCPNPLSFAACNPDPGQPTTCSVACAPLCPGGHGPCIYPPDAPIMFPPAPVVIGADLNDGEAQLGIQGQVDDMFIIQRAVSPEEMRAYRERRQYSPAPIVATVAL